MRCDRCAGDWFTKAGRDRARRQLHRCSGCGRRVTACTGSAFSGYRFPDAVIALAVRSYLRYRLRYKGRVRPMRRFKTTGTASTFCRGHALIRDLARGFSRLAAGTPPRLRLTTAGETLATML